MTLHSKTRLRLVTLIYWMLLIYIVAALIWWFISLDKQNLRMADLKNELIRSSAMTENEKIKAFSEIDTERKRNKKKYVAEGVTFLILTFIGAGFVYRSARRQFRLQQQQQNFMMAITHELKTPISVTTLNLETLQKYQLDPEKQKKIIQTTLKETARLNTLTNNILVSSQIEGEGYAFSKEELDLSDLFRDCILDFRNRYPERVFMDDIEADTAIVGDALLLQMLINNLIENAIKYSGKDNPVICRLKKRDHSILLCIIDEGPGIPEVEKKKIFGKFYRIGNESIRKTQGTGLGLYLCQRIAKDHNADIVVTNNLPRGSIFTINFHL